MSASTHLLGLGNQPIATQVAFPAHAEEGAFRLFDSCWQLRNTAKAGYVLKQCDILPRIPRELSAWRQQADRLVNDLTTAKRVRRLVIAARAGRHVSMGAHQRASATDLVIWLFESSLFLYDQHQAALLPQFPGPYEYLCEVLWNRFFKDLDGEALYLELESEFAIAAVNQPTTALPAAGQPILVIPSLTPEGDLESGNPSSVQTSGLARNNAGAVPPNESADRAREISAPPAQSPEPHTPRWDNARRELWYANRCIRRFNRHPAPNQVKLIEHFQAQDWECCIESPWPNDRATTNKARQYLNQSIESHAQKHGLQGFPSIRFRGDGTGDCLCWDRTNDG